MRTLIFLACCFIASSAHSFEISDVPKDLRDSAAEVRSMLDDDYDDDQYIIQSINQAVYLMHLHINLSYEEAEKIKNIDLRVATTGAIKGAIAGIAGGTPISVLLGAALGALADVAGESYGHYSCSRSFLRKAYYFSKYIEWLEVELYRSRGWDIKY